MLHSINQWKSETELTNGDSYLYYRNKKKQNIGLKNFIVDKENEKTVMLCDALGVDEK